ADLLVAKIHEIGIEDMGQSGPAYAPGGGHHQHGHFAIQFDDDGLDHSVTGYLHMVGKLLCCKSRGVGLAQVLRASLVQIFFELLYRHKYNLLTAWTVL